VKKRGSVFIEFKVISKPNSKKNYYLRGLKDREHRDKVACGVVLESTLPS